jgi:hypothetical protein
MCQRLAPAMQPDAAPSILSVRHSEDVQTQACHSRPRKPVTRAATVRQRAALLSYELVMSASSRIAFLHSGNSGTPPAPLAVVVPFTDPALTAAALEAAQDLARPFDAAVTLMAVHVVPYPSPLECREGIRRRLEEELRTMARAIPAAVRVQVVFARGQEEVYRSMLRPESLVVVGTRLRWWRTREERFGRRLAASGHSVALIGVR